MKDRDWDVFDLKVALRGVGREVSESTIRRWLDDSREPQYGMLPALKAVFGSIDEFLEPVPSD